MLCHAAACFVMLCQAARVQLSQQAELLNQAWAVYTPTMLSACTH